MPLIQYLNSRLPEIPPYFGIYLPILDSVNALGQFIIEDKATGFRHFPCPHLKIFGKHSGWTRSVQGMKLDMGVEGGSSYIMLNNTPYIHLKYLFKNRRMIRGAKISDEIQTISERIPRSISVATIDEMFFPEFLTKWWREWDEPKCTW